MKDSLIIVACFFLGLMLGVTGTLPGIFQNPDLSVYALYALLFLVGFGLGSDDRLPAMIRQINLKILLIPAGIVIGSLGGAGAVSVFFPDLGLKEALAVVSGFGYYSLSSILLTQIHSETLGVMALLSNVMREIATLVLASAFVRLFGRFGAIAAGGATAMDTTLPVIVRYSGREYAVISVFSGIVLTTIAPVLIPLIINGW